LVAAPSSLEFLAQIVSHLVLQKKARSGEPEYTLS